MSGPPVYTDVILQSVRRKPTTSVGPVLLKNVQCAKLDLVKLKNLSGHIQDLFGKWYFICSKQGKMQIISSVLMTISAFMDVSDGCDNCYIHVIKLLIVYALYYTNRMKMYIQKDNSIHLTQTL